MSKKIPAKGHTYGNWVVKEQASCTKEGIQERICTACGYRVSKKIPARGHTYTTITTKATTKKNGRIVKKCKICRRMAKTTTLYSPKIVTLSKKSYTYSGKACKPTVTIKGKNGKKIPAANYSITYKNNKAVGKASVKISFKGNYSGTITQTFTIQPKGTILTKITTNGKSLTARWKKQARQVNGYEVQYSTSKKFAKKQTVSKTVKQPSVTKLTVKGLKGRKKYYIRIRTYKIVKGKKFFSAWSSTETVKPGK